MKTSHILLIILIALIAGFGGAKLAGRSDKVETAKAESAYERVMRTGTIRCGYALSPNVLVKDPNTGALSGLDYDYWQELGRQLGLKIDWVYEAGWGNFTEDLRSDKYDAFCSGIWPNENRNKYLSLSLPVVYSFVNAYVRSDDHRFDNNPSQLNQPHVIMPVLDGDISEAMARRRFPEAHRLSMPNSATWADFYLAVMDKKADVILMEQGGYEDLAKQHPGALRQLEGADHLFTFASYYAFRNGEIALRDMVNTALRTLIDDGTLATIAKRYSPYYLVATPNYPAPLK